jgi:predicted nucleic acid-binding protein
MSELIVSDSACLIGLERIGRLEILPALFQSICIPPAVQREFGVTLPWLRVVAPTDLALVLALGMLVDDGEAEAIALAHERAARVILDDRQARAVAQRMGVGVIGTVGVLVNARRQQIIPSLSVVLAELEHNGFFIGSRLKEEALRLVGE